MLLPVGAASAQDAQPEGQIYIVQPGDTLSGIAAKFGVSIEDLIRVNQIANPDNLVVGTRLIIPGPGTISGIYPFLTACGKLSPL
jgi:LysM repeat protein